MYKQKYLFFPLIILLCLLPDLTYSQLYVGSSYGLQIPGRQDLKFRLYNNGELIENIRTTEVHSRVTPILNFNISYWFKKYGVRFDYYGWEHISEANEFLTNELPPFYRIEQGRDGIFFNILRKSRFPFSGKKEIDASKHAFFGIGIGRTFTEVEKGRNQWRWAFKVSYGISYQITKRINAVFEFNYLLTMDIDTLPNKNGWFVDTSGRWFPLRFGPHWDTRYYAFQFGLQYRVFN